ncbi:MAG TPA: hypothetical protein C5S37_04405 [Methanophagales archaeon]|nr:hypothetical protein [Methanophagales archaeon]
MKKAIVTIMLAIFAVSSVLLVLAASSTTVSIGSNSTAKGDTAVVPLMISDVANLGGVGINLTFDESVVNVTALENSDFDSPPNLNTRGPGWIVLEGGQYESGLSDNVKLCDVTLEAVGEPEESSYLNLTGIVLEDMAMNPITVDAVINGTFTIQVDTTAPIIKAEPMIIPEDTDNEPLWGEMSTIDATDDSAISTITVDLSAMGGSAITNVSNAGNHSDVTFWCVFNVTNASVGTANWNETLGTYLPYCLPVNATDIYDNSNTSVCISLTVMKNGDVMPYDGDCTVDFLHDALYLVRHTKGISGYEDIRENIADVTGDGTIDFLHDALYLVRHTKGVTGYEILK